MTGIPRSTVADPTADAYRAAGRLVSLASLGGAAGDILQAFISAALVWAAAEKDLIVAQFVGPMATRSGDRPDLTLRATELKEREAHRAFEAAARDVAAWSASRKETP